MFVVVVVAVVVVIVTTPMFRIQAAYMYLTGLCFSSLLQNYGVW